MTAFRLSDLPPAARAVARRLERQATQPPVTTPAPCGPLTFVAPMPPTLTNGGMGRSRNWRAMHGEKTAYWRQLDALLAARRLPAVPDAPIARATIASVMVLGGAMDDDNAMARHKWLVDWLRARGYVADDRKRNLTWAGFPVQRVRRGQGYTITLTLTPEPT